MDKNSLGLGKAYAGVGLFRRGSQWYLVINDQAVRLYSNQAKELGLDSTNTTIKSSTHSREKV